MAWHTKALCQHRGGLLVAWAEDQQSLEAAAQTTLHTQTLEKKRNSNWALRVERAGSQSSWPPTL